MRNSTRTSAVRLAVAWVTLFIVGTDLFVVSPLLRSWEQGFHVSVSTAGYAVTAFAVAYVLGAPQLGGLADRFSRRRLLLISLTCFAVANAATGAAQWFPMLVAARLIAGLSVAGCTPSVYALVTESAPDGRRAAWLGITTSGLLSALWAGAPAGELVAAHFGWRSVFFGLSGITLVLMAVNRVIWAERPAGRSATRGHTTTLQRVRGVSTTTLWAAGVYGFYTYLVSGLRGQGWETGRTAAALAVYGVCAVVASLGGGRLADRWHPRRTVSAGLLGLTGALILIGIVVRVSIPLTLVGLAVMAAAAYPVFPAQQAELLRRFPAAESARILAWNQSAMYVGIAAGSVFGGAVMNGAGFRYLPFVCAGAAFAGFAASLIATRGRQFTERKDPGVSHSKGRRALRLGLVFEQAAARHPRTTVELDHRLDAWPERGRRLTYRELAELTEDAAAGLAAAGITPGSRVAVYKHESFDIVILACALSRIGALPVMLSPALDADTVTALLTRLDRPYLVSDAEKLDALAGKHLDRITASVVLAAGRRNGIPALADFAGAPRPEPVPADPDQPAIVTHTSGTTGLPKLAVQSARTLWWRFLPQALMASAGGKRETVAFCLSFVHSRMYSGLGVLLWRGLPAVVLTDPSPDNVAAMFARTRPGIVETLPNCFLNWEGIADDPREPLSNVMCYSSTFDALHPRTVRRLLGASRRRFPVMVQLYGQSETGPVAVHLYTRRTAQNADGRCLGFAMPGLTRLRARTADGEPGTVDQPGFIEARTRGRALTYLCEEARFSRELHGSWWRMGDVGYRTRRGCMHVLDREVDQIPGVPSNLHIEDVLLERLPELTEIVVIPDAARHPVPVICTRGGQPIGSGRWAAATDGLPPLEPPVQCDWSSLPRTSTWKIRRLELARQLRHDLLNQSGHAGS